MVKTFTFLLSLPIVKQNEVYRRPRVKCGPADRTCGPATEQNAAANPNLNLNDNANSYANRNPEHKP